MHTNDFKETRQYWYNPIKSVDVVHACGSCFFFLELNTSTSDSMSDESYSESLQISHIL